MSFKFLFMTLTVAFMSLNFNGAFADESVKDKAAEVGSDTKRGLKKSVREVKDKTCELVNGKMECAANKVKHSIQNGADKIEDAVD